MSALDNVSEWGTYQVPVKFTVEYETTVTLTANDSGGISEQVDDYVKEYYDDIAGEVVAMTGKSELKEIKEVY
ncbi:hypothetical protein [Staphylococcus pseudoxylosus]|uniref:hypothetical protein n=1 Tax=Staphylococcus pseudoxylosus TaxID=2282419 RepID=UPI000D1F8E14|nr:hypothetical protein [Staphylococcus pseudoxylosus]MBM2657580.1 hypothetical protein [Staphylococcus pseudoxylosus]MEB5782424.1 hypothetical protein [Staphylococcus pseudoxylosus]PTI83654.1 hypothetical protein BU098_01865 [Staphylococcus xylosus]